jgi:hypothetical protein
MKVKQKYTNISESFLYELALSQIRGKKHYYAFWLSIKEESVNNLNFEETLYLSKLEDAQNQAFKRPNLKRK